MDLHNIWWDPVDLVDWLFGPVDGSTGTRRPRRGVVPDVRGLDVAQAMERLWSEGFKAQTRQLEPRPVPVMGVVEGQWPAPGTKWNRAKTVRLDVRHPPQATPVE